jgi:hypothetical protein
MLHENGPCDLCKRDVSNITKHHLIPKTRHKNKKNKKNFTRDDVHNRVLWICRPCHSNIHVVLTEKELEYDFNSIEALRIHPKIEKFSAWIRNKPEGTQVPFAKGHRRKK